MDTISFFYSTFFNRQQVLDCYLFFFVININIQKQNQYYSIIKQKLYQQKPNIRPQDQSMITIAPQMNQNWFVSHFPSFPSAQQAQPPPSTHILNYSINLSNPIGSGNFSTVYPCSQLDSQPYLQSMLGNANRNGNKQKLAVKIINLLYMKNTNLLQLVKNQIEILQKMKHRNVLSCRDAYMDWNKGWAYIFMDCYQSNLEQYAKKIRERGGKRGMEEKDVVGIIRGLIDGLCYLETNCILHRDIKPANIFISTSPQTGQPIPIIADLGFSTPIPTPFYDLQIGSPPYMAPQSLISSLYHQKSDVYSFGVLVYELLHGENPFMKARDRNQLIRMVMKPIQMSELKYDLSIQIKLLICACMELDIGKRVGFREMKGMWWFQRLMGNAGLGNSVIMENKLAMKSQIIQSRPQTSQPFNSILTLSRRLPQNPQLSVPALEGTPKKQSVSTLDYIPQLKSSVSLLNIHSVSPNNCLSTNNASGDKKDSNGNKSPIFNRLTRLKTEICKKKDAEGIVSVFNVESAEENKAKVKEDEDIEEDSLHSCANYQIKTISPKATRLSSKYFEAAKINNFSSKQVPQNQKENKSNYSFWTVALEKLHSRPMMTPLTESSTPNNASKHTYLQVYSNKESSSQIEQQSSLTLQPIALSPSPNTHKNKNNKIHHLAKNGNNKNLISPIKVTKKGTTASTKENQIGGVIKQKKQLQKVKQI